MYTIEDEVWNKFLCVVDDIASIEIATVDRLVEQLEDGLPGIRKVARSRESARAPA